MTGGVDVGDAFLIPSGPSGSHLFVVCTGETQSGFRLLVSISTVREGKHHDPTRIVEPGAHPFVTARSYVAYGKADQRTTEHILRCVEKGLFIPKPAVSQELLEHILSGFDESDFTKPWVFELLET